MWPYIFCFVIVLLLSKTNEIQLKKKGNKINLFLCSAFIILIPAILAGLRDYSVGTDIKLHYQGIFNNALQFNRFSDFYKYMISKYKDWLNIGYLIFTYIISRFTDNLHWLLFFISLFNGSFIYAALYKSRKRNSIFLGELVYLTIIYNESFNAVRQVMALSICLYALAFLFERKYVKYCLLMVLAYTFHTSSLIALSFPIIMFFINDNKAKNMLASYSLKQKIWWWLKILILACVISIGAASIQLIVTNLSSSGIISDRILFYINTTRNYRSSIIELTVYLAPLLVVFWQRNNNFNGYTLLTIELINLILFPLRERYTYLYRASTFFVYCRIFSLTQIRSSLYKVIRTKRFSKNNLKSLIVIIMCFTYWYYFTVYLKYNATIPYTSEIMKIIK